MNQQIQIEINYICYELNRRIKQMNYEEELNIREFLEYGINENDTYLDITEEETSYIASALNVNEDCIFDLFVDMEYIELEEDDEQESWNAQDRADDINDERRLGI